jgi:hypothetical protein
MRERVATRVASGSTETEFRYSLIVTKSLAPDRGHRCNRRALLSIAGTITRRHGDAWPSLNDLLLPGECPATKDGAQNDKRMSHMMECPFAREVTLGWEPIFS